MRVFLPKDAAALALGAEAVLRALREAAARRGVALEVVRTGSRGAVWLEPLVELETPAGRIGYGPVRAGDAAGLLEAWLDEDGAHPLRIGPPESHPWFAGQTRLTFGRCGVVDPESVEDYAAHGGFAGLLRALSIGGEAIVDAVKLSGLRGRGGAGFPTGIKWNTVRLAEADRKYVVCNADEGDSGTFADRMLMEGDPFLLIEGMAIAGVAVGATKGYVYVRSEYPQAVRAMRTAILAARWAGWLGEDVAGSGQAFDLEVRVGAGAYICGEETALLNSLEGKRGVVRAKPPLPAVEGLFGRPTVVNNVLSLAAVPWILAHGAEAYAGFGSGRSLGTLAVQIAGNVRRGGLVEIPFGLPLRDVVEGWGGGTATGRPFRAVQVGGPLGAYFPEALLDTPLDYEAFARAGGLLGHGGVTVFDDRVDLSRQARFAFEFCAAESCGKCTPCRIGAVRGAEVIDRITTGVDVARNLAVLDDLLELMTDASLCAMGGLTPIPVGSALKHFPEDFDAARGLSRAAE
ncbi:formate dehydrogenase [Roseomonas nepalensis]|uniref:Formate dehydrogenase n=1 Tax=Muricoccus nepalensis TaxID=1854500 RepID=A0A502GBH0_9PROT|nr:NADH-ubiquinone oxidoreductase-F iron-sulfur binding region domain-containing protein [Roseomonas nepalensis]TPG59071.1 formate dehydrogenase [Roseomonas nepalensis]